MAQLLVEGAKVNSGTLFFTSHFSFTHPNITMHQETIIHHHRTPPRYLFSARNLFSVLHSTNRSLFKSLKSSPTGIRSVTKNGRTTCRLCSIKEWFTHFSVLSVFFFTKLASFGYFPLHHHHPLDASAPIIDIFQHNPRHVY